MSAADGYARITHRPACVVAHVDVGTAALGQGLHNASSGRAPVLIFAGIAPSTLNGEAPGSRSESMCNGTRISPTKPPSFHPTVATVQRSNPLSMFRP